MTIYNVAHERVPFLTPAQRRLLGAVADCLIPAGADGAPSAGEVGVAAEVEGMAGNSARSRALLTGALKAVESASGTRHARSFLQLSQAERTYVLRDVEASCPDLFAALLRDAYIAYYGSEQVLRAKGLPSAPPQPQGYAMEPFNAALLEGVRARGKRYRHA